MFAGRPVIGLAGGIGSGKSFVAGLFAELGCAVIDSDAQVRSIYEDPSVKQTLREWWGEEILLPDGGVNRRAVAERIFNDAGDRRRLEGLLYPLVARQRRQKMRELSQNQRVVAFVWDTPLLFEAGLNSECDAVVFVEAPAELRLERLARDRGWDGAELRRRENLQWPLDRKREISDYMIRNAADAGDARRQVRDVLSRILAREWHGPGPE
jgi:dephospho-CoA kinase